MVSLGFTKYWIKYTKSRQKQIKYYDFIPFFDFQYEKIIFNCQPSHFSPCSAVPVADKTNAPRKCEQLDYKYQTATDLKKTYDPKIRNKLTFKLQRTANEYAAERSFAVLYSVSTSVNLYVKLFRIWLYTYCKNIIS